MVFIDSLVKAAGSPADTSKYYGTEMVILGKASSIAFNNFTVVFLRKTLLPIKLNLMGEICYIANI